MKLGIFLSVGDSFSNMKKTGQDVRFINLYLKPYQKHFSKIYVFSYEDERIYISKNISVVPNKNKLNRFVYGLLLPLINKGVLKECDAIRGFGITSSVSSFLINRLTIKKKIPFIFNWAYDYIEFSKIEKKYIYIPFYWLLEKFAFQKADKVFIAIKSKLKTLDKGKFVYLPNGVDTKLFNPSKSQSKNLVFVGRLEKQKNLRFLISSVSKLKREFRQITFVGQGSEEKSLKEYALKKRVKLTIIHQIPNRELPKFISKFKIFTLSSFAEGSPKALLEAMSCGLVPVITNFKTAKESLTNKKEGFIVDYDKKLFASKIEYLLENPKELGVMAQNARERINIEFNLNYLLKHEIETIKRI